MKVSDNLVINLAGDKAEIIIQGIIGLPGEWQFREEEIPENLVTTKEKMSKELKAISNLKASRIKVLIDSDGGSVSHAMSMINALRNHKAKVSVEYVGWSASAATLFGVAADNNDVTAPSNMLALIHQVTSYAMGTPKQMRTQIEIAEKASQMCAQTYSEQTGLPEETFQEIMSRNDGEGEWLTAKELKELNLIKTIKDEPLEVAAVRFDQFNKLKPISNNLKNQIMFNKKKKGPVNQVSTCNDENFIYEGEVFEVGVEVKMIGSSEDSFEGTYELRDGRTFDVNNKNEVTAINELNNEERNDSDSLKEEITNVVAELIAEFKEDMQNQFEKRFKGSNHQPPKKGQKKLPENNYVDPQAEAGRMVREKMKEIEAKKRKVREA